MSADNGFRKKLDDEIVRSRGIDQDVDQRLARLETSIIERIKKKIVVDPHIELFKDDKYRAIAVSVKFICKAIITVSAFLVGGIQIGEFLKGLIMW